MRTYVLKRQNAAISNLIGKTGYYADILKVVQQKHLRLGAIGTSNYTTICETVLSATSGLPTIRYLNGSLSEFYDPYRNEIVPETNLPRTSGFVVPFLFTQSGTKPITSIDMARRYVSYFDEMKQSDAVVVVGFGFNGDDGHINGMFRKLMEDHNRRLIVCVHAPDGKLPFDLNEQKRRYGRLLRTSREDLITIVRIGENRNSAVSESWLESVISAAT